MIVLFIFSIIFIIIGIGIFDNAKKTYTTAQQIKVDKQQEIQEKEETLKILKDNIEIYVQETTERRKDLQQIQEDYNKKIDTVSQLNTDIANLKLDKQNCIVDIKDAKTNYLDIIEKAYLKAEEDYQKALKDIDEQTAQKEKQSKEKIAEIEKELHKIAESLNAAIDDRLREQEKENNLAFYKLAIDKRALQDIEVLDKVKTNLNQPVILSKLIWTTFFQKQTNDLCSRVLGNNTVIGIYKITNLETKEVYIGQSVDIATRWKSHIKCGLGIDAAPNKLYRSMQDTGVWNFTFELLEKCSKEELNEKEKLFINLYQTDKFGLNSTSGGS